MSFTLLVVDHDSIIREQVATYLNHKYQVLEADSGEKALSLMQSQPVDMIVLDLVLPLKSGLDLLKEVRGYSDLPIIFLTTRNGMEDQISAYEAGADGYILKPCDLKLLSLKIGNVLKRTYPGGVENRQVLVHGELEVNKQSRIVKLSQEAVPFRPKEFDLLVFLMDHAGSALDRDKILDAIWGVDYFGDSRVVDTHVKKIRKKIGPYATDIQTVFGVGYKFNSKIKGTA